MTFTRTPPTKPGAYWWRDNQDAPSLLGEVGWHFDGTLCLIGGYKHGHRTATIGGEWCGPLVPADELVKAYFEGWVDRGIAGPEDTQLSEFANSNARKAVEGDRV